MSYNVFQNPIITRMVPSAGPQAGGTLVTMFGHNLAIGNKNVTVCFKTDITSIPCEAASVIKANVLEDSIVTKSPPSNGASELRGIEVGFDGNTRREIETVFKYLPDPIVDAIHPSKSIVR